MRNNNNNSGGNNSMGGRGRPKRDGSGKGRRANRGQNPNCPRRTSK